MIEEQMNEMAEAFLRWPLPDDVCADDIACKAGAPHRTGTNLLTAHQALAMIRFVCRPELTAMHADVERLSAELAALRADAERYRWLADKVLACDYGDNDKGCVGWHIRHCKGPAWIAGDSIDAAIDAAIARNGA